MKVFDCADKKKKLLFGPLSWPTVLPALGYVPKQTFERQLGDSYWRRCRVHQGVDREWPAW